MTLDRAAVRKIAILARLDVPEDELDGYARELGGILDWVEQLREVDTQGVAPMTGAADKGLPQRPDVVTDGNCRDKVMANNPAGDPVFFVVPKVVE